MNEQARFTIETWGSGNTPDEIEADGIRRARLTLGGYTGELRLPEPYRIHRTEIDLRKSEAATGLTPYGHEARSAAKLEHSLFAMFWVEGVSGGDGEQPE